MQPLVVEGRTMVAVTHEMALARPVSNHVIVLPQDRVEEQGAPSTVLEQPRSGRLKQFLSCGYLSGKSPYRVCDEA